MSEPNNTPQQLPQLPPIDLATILRVIWSSGLGGLFKLILGALIAGASGGMVVSHQVKQVIPDMKGGILEKIRQQGKKAEDAIGQIRFGNKGCTATVIGPIHSNDLYVDVLTAAHCVNVGEQGVMKLKDGRTLSVRCVARNPAADCAWLRANKPADDIPYLLLADELPPAGSKVWHQGYGIDKPGNRENGSFQGIANRGLQCQYHLSVSPGDSGGGIVLADGERVLSPVCCTTRLSGPGTVYGATPQQCRELRPVRIVSYPDAPPVNPVRVYSNEEVSAGVW